MASLFDETKTQGAGGQTEALFAPEGTQPVNLSRRRFLMGSAGVASGALVLGFGIPLAAPRVRAAEAGAGKAFDVPAFIEIRPDNTLRFLSPFMEGGQGTFTAMAQIVGEELDMDPAVFTVEAAPAGEVFQIMNGRRVTGGSNSVRSSYDTMRRIGASGRAMLLQAGAKRLGVPLAQLSTQPGKVVHAASGRSVTYGELAADARDMAVPDAASVTLRDPSTFRWIGKPVARLDMHMKSTGKAVYAIDCKVEDLLQAAVQHAPRLGLQPGVVRNEAAVKAMPGVHSVHVLEGAVAVVAPYWWHARQAADALDVEWKEPANPDDVRYMPADFATEAFAAKLAAETGRGEQAETAGDVAGAFASAATTLEATYRSQYLHHAQLEPPSTLARFNADGTLDMWLPNQVPEMFQAAIAKQAGLEPAQVKIHSPLLGGFFGRHFLYKDGNPYPHAIALAKATGRPVKVIWSREEEFLRDPLRPMAVVKFRGALDKDGWPVGLDVVSVCEGPSEGIANARGKELDDSALEGITGKSYAIANRRIAQAYVKNPPTLAYWRSVGNSMNDFFYESFLDEMADKGGKDPYALRLRLLAGNARLTNLLKAAVDLSGGWKRGPFTAADGSRRARGLAMASPFGSEAAAVAEVSIKDGQVVVHDIWEAIDPGSIVNPAIVAAQVNSAVALGLSQVLVEGADYEDGLPVARNFDAYSILPPDRMANVHVKIIESGAKMGGIGEPPLPAVPPAVANAVSALTGKRVRAMPLSRETFTT
ncbi:xanthine dehydrogenase family protein molybdopterin-binding subunit [Novosphingobium profundi]|uniref:xanthine dehydrogenase family protein molybdopterin-binding subunit n=1 Tax=Novosphingobium profundi TaxID=1774954 RepID=UPI001BDA5645|nr:molybdopterin cofactor-binding domain-containing protein [Novosphingobium profundi]MBT0667471.1 xanthine dehydrogenase family protein molybdopterin-binding subunit [Novosphingobium profundi]